MTRQKQLLLAVAADFKRGAVPLNETFLREHEVTFDECLNLTDTIAAVLRGYALAPLHITTMCLVASCTQDADEAALMVSTMEAAYARKQIIDRLGAMNSKAPQTENNLPVP